MHLVRPLQVLDGEPLRCRRELLLQFGKRICTPLLRAVEEDLDGLDLFGVLLDERAKR
jgi:hypothetical protein